MAKYIGKRLIYMAVTLFVVAALTFTLMKILPGSPFDEERFLTREEVSKLLHVDFSTLWRWNKLKLLCCIKVGPRRVMYKYSDVMKKLNGEENDETKREG